MTAPAERHRAGLAGALLGITVVLLASSLVIGLTGGEGWGQKLGTAPVLLAFALVGALVGARTGNRLGWLFLAVGLVGAVGLMTIAYAGRAPTAELPGAAWVGWITPLVLAILQPMIFLTPLLFPDGRPPSRRWRPVVWLAVIAGLGQFVTAALSDVDFSTNFHMLRDPVTVVAPLSTVYNLAQEATLLVLPVSVIALIVRFRRSRQDERLQLKWVMYASVVVGVIILIAALLSNNPLLAFDIVFPLIPAAVGVAILKYRLYDIDRLISRTLAYAIVTGLLVGVYAALVLLATQVFRFHTPVAVAAATLAAAALFSPLRRRVQRAVDRRFNRSRYDADQTVAAFAARLKDAVDLGAVEADLASVVQRALEPAHVSVWISERG
jgi:peptidoglycan/LPS O-acetylase OafA/YrhL